MKLFRSPLFFTVIVALTVDSCESPVEQNPYFTLDPEPVLAITDFTPDIPGALTHFSRHDSTFLFFDNELGKIITTDLDFNIKAIFGEQGEGPNEYRNTPSISIIDNQIIAVDLNKVLYYRLDGDIDSVVTKELPFSLFAGSSYSEEHQKYYFIPEDEPVQIVALSKDLQREWIWGEATNNLDKSIVLPLPDTSFLRIGTNDGEISRLSSLYPRDALDSFSLYQNFTYRNEAHLLEEMFEGKWEMISFPIAQQVLRFGDYLFIKLGTQPTDGRPTGFGATDVRKWLVLRWNPQLALVAEWEVPVEKGYLYAGFVIAPDSNALIAYEMGRGEFHRLPFPEGFGE